MESIRSSVPGGLKGIIKSIVENDNSPFKSESEFIRLAVGHFATRFLEYCDTDSRAGAQQDQDTWEDILFMIIKVSEDGISTLDLKKEFPGLENVMYYHLNNLRERGFINFLGVEDSSDGKSGYWKATDLGWRLKNAKGWKR